MNATWISDTELMYRDRKTVSSFLQKLIQNIILINEQNFNYKQRNITIYDALRGTETVIADVKISEINKANEYKMSPDKKYLLLATDTISVSLYVQKKIWIKLFL